MLRATFLGHQGWSLSTANTHVLVDPLLTDGFGHGGLAGRVFPPRRFSVEQMPKIDAVWLTHEHDDHFDLPSLSGLPRSVPIHASSRSSVALHGVLADLGFSVRRVDPNAATHIGDITLRTFVADHRTTPLTDEWDVLPFLATDAQGHGAFASSVDAGMPDALLDALASMPERRWVFCMANNTTDVRFVREGLGVIAPTDDTDVLATVLTRRWQRVAARAAPPAFTAITGGGWSHPEDVAWINRVAFCVDPGRLAASLAHGCRTRAAAVRPGDQITLAESGIEESTSSWVTATDAVRPAPSAVDVPDDVAPASGSRRLADWSPLEAGLGELARYLFGRSFFTAAFASATEHPLAIVLRDDTGDRVYAWRPSSASFERTETDPATFLCGLRLWATDLQGLLEGTLGASAICYTGRVRCWSHEPERLRIDPHLLWSFAHPLHRPEIARRLYDRLAR